MAMSEARKKRREFKRKLNKDSEFIKYINIPDTYLRIRLALPHNLSKKQVQTFLLYVSTRCEVDPKFKEAKLRLDALVEERIKDQLKDKIKDEQSTSNS